MVAVRSETCGRSRPGARNLVLGGAHSLHATAESAQTTVPLAVVPLASPDPARLDRLTERESEVAQAVGRGLPNAEIAATLFMSVPTVKTHVDRIFDKLEVRNRVEVAICIHDANLGEQPRKGRG